MKITNSTIGKESLICIIDAFEDFLEKKGVERLPKGVKLEEGVAEEDAAIIYGEDFDELYNQLAEILANSGIHVADVYDERQPIAETEDITIYVPSRGEILVIKEGTGDNLDSEDEEEGYKDYIDYDVYESDDPLSGGDGGMILSKEFIKEKYSSMEDAIPEVLDYVYDTSDLTYVILGGGKPFLMTPKRLAKAWKKVVDLFDSFAAYEGKITPDDTAKAVMGALGGIDQALEVFAAVVRFKEHDGRISPQNREMLAKIPIDESCLVREHSNAFFTEKLDSIHTSYINQIIDALKKYAV